MKATKELAVVSRSTINKLLNEAADFALRESKITHELLYGVTDGKAVGTHIENMFRSHLEGKYTISEKGNVASGLDIPSLNIDIKTTSIKQPQSSCPFRSARQKIFGLGYHLLVFVYEKTDDIKTKSGRLNFLHTVFVEQERTADFTLTKLLNDAKAAGANKQDIISILTDRNLPVDDIEADKIADEILSRKVEQGFLTISNVLQWRLQYQRVIDVAGKESGIIKVGK